MLYRTPAFRGPLEDFHFPSSHHSSWAFPFPYLGWEGCSVVSPWLVSLWKPLECPAGSFPDLTSQLLSIPLQIKNSSLGLASAKAHFYPSPLSPTLYRMIPKTWVATCFERDSDITHIISSFITAICISFSSQRHAQAYQSCSVVQRSKCLNLPREDGAIPICFISQLYHCFLIKLSKLYKWGTPQMPQFTAAAAAVAASADYPCVRGKLVPVNWGSIYKEGRKRRPYAF